MFGELLGVVGGLLFMMMIWVFGVVVGSVVMEVVMLSICVLFVFIVVGELVITCDGA